MPTQHSTPMLAAQPAACPQHAPTIDWSPFLTVAGRLLQYLVCHAGPVPHNRPLAVVLGCSAGALPGAWRELEEGGYIARAADGAISLLIGGDHYSDQRDQKSDQRDHDSDHPDQIIDHPPIAADRAATPNPAAVAVAADQDSDQRDQKIDPPHTPHNGTFSSSSSSYRAPLENDLRAAGVYPGLARKVAARCPDRTIAEFQSDVALAERQGKQNPVPFVATLWADGDRVREVIHAPRSRSVSGAARAAQPSGPAQRGVFTTDLSRLRG